MGAPAIILRLADTVTGKSTMVGVLTRSMLDDGRGAARSKVFKHGHEESTGRTSSIGQHNLCVRLLLSGCLAFAPPRLHRELYQRMTRAWRRSLKYHRSQTIRVS